MGKVYLPLPYDDVPAVYEWLLPKAAYTTIEKITKNTHTNIYIYVYMYIYIFGYRNTTYIYI